jgi:hypothetical protein
MAEMIPFRHAGNPDREIDFDLYVDLLVLHYGFNRRDAEIKVRKECRRDDLRIIRSDPANNLKPSRISGEPRPKRCSRACRTA